MTPPESVAGSVHDVPAPSQEEQANPPLEYLRETVEEEKEEPEPVMSPGIERMTPVGRGRDRESVAGLEEEVAVLHEVVRDMRMRHALTKEKNRTLLENHMRLQSMFEAHCCSAQHHLNHKQSLQNWVGGCLTRASHIQHQYITGAPPKQSTTPGNAEWHAYIDKHSNRIYYHNTITNATTWDEPREEVDASRLFQHL